MAYEPKLIIQIPGGGAIERQLVDDPPPPVGTGLVVVDVGATDAEGNLEPPAAGEVVLSVPAPGALTRDPDRLHRVLARAEAGAEPLVVEVEVAEGLSEAELKLILDAAARARRPVILRVMRNL
ncbi:MAG TPA: hypothetical protein VKR21_11290 [Solirubrobacteraceae bacterium]|nr:hypothetical protein [Solirubrobacteraceae bacterium]